MGGRKVEALKIKQAYQKSSVQGDELAAYAFDMLQTLRENCSDDKHRFLSYLIGMAAEEAQRLAEGLPSAADQFAKQPAGMSVSKSSDI